MWGYVRGWVQAILQEASEQGVSVEESAESIWMVLELLRERVRDPRYIPLLQGGRQRMGGQGGGSKEHREYLGLMREHMRSVELEMMRMARDRIKGEQEQRELLLEVVKMKHVKQAEGEEYQGLKSYLQELERERMGLMVAARDRHLVEDVKAVVQEDESPAQREPEVGKGLGEPSEGEESPWGLTPGEHKKRRTDVVEKGVEQQARDSSDSGGSNVVDQEQVEVLQQLEAKGRKREIYLAEKGRALQLMRVERVQLELEMEKEAVRKLKEGGSSQGLSTQGIEEGQVQVNRVLGWSDAGCEGQQEELREEAQAGTGGPKEESQEGPKELAVSRQQEKSGGTKGEAILVKSVKEELQDLHQQWAAVLGEIKIMKKEAKTWKSVGELREDVREEAIAEERLVAKSRKDMKEKLYDMAGGGPMFMGEDLERRMQAKIARSKEGGGVTSSMGARKGMGEASKARARSAGSKQEGSWAVYEDEGSNLGRDFAGNRGGFGRFEGRGMARGGGRPPLGSAGGRGMAGRGQGRRFGESLKQEELNQGVRGRTMTAGSKRPRAMSAVDVPSRSEMGKWQSRGRKPEEQSSRGAGPRGYVCAEQVD